MVEVTNSPGTMANDNAVGTVAWVTVDNAKLSDNNYATITLNATNSNYLKANNFNFSIPSGATINGIKLEIERHSDSGFSNYLDGNVKLIHSNGNYIAENKASTTAWNTTINTYYTYGGEDDLWGENWNASDINNSNFGAAVSLKYIGGPTYISRVDHIQITVYYTEGGITYTSILPAFRRST